MTVDVVDPNYPPWRTSLLDTTPQTSDLVSWKQSHGLILCVYTVKFYCHFHSLISSSHLPKLCRKHRHFFVTFLVQYFASHGFHLNTTLSSLSSYDVLMFPLPPVSPHFPPFGLYSPVASRTKELEPAQSHSGSVALSWPSTNATQLPRSWLICCLRFFTFYGLFSFVCFFLGLSRGASFLAFPSLHLNFPVTFCCPARMRKEGRALPAQPLPSLPQLSSSHRVQITQITHTKNRVVHVRQLPLLSPSLHLHRTGVAPLLSCTSSASYGLVRSG